MNRDVICDVVTVVSQWRGIKREKPDSGNSKILQIVESLGEPREVADAVGIAVAERADVELINYRIFVPEVVFLPRQRSILRSILKCLQSLAAISDLPTLILDGVLLSSRSSPY